MGKRGRRRAREQVARAATAATGGSALPAATSYTEGTSLEALQELVATRVAVERRIRDVVDELIATGITWARIGAVLGMTRQGARQGHLRRHQQRP